MVRPKPGECCSTHHDPGATHNGDSTMIPIILITLAVEIALYFVHRTREG